MMKTLAISDTKKSLKFLKLISKEKEIIVRPTKGYRTIFKADNIFHAGIDSDFLKYKTNVGSHGTNKMEVQVFEQTHDGKLSQLFADFGQNLDALCLTQDQIISFVEGHDKWLSRSGWGTLFLFKVQGWHFVSAVNRNSTGPYVYMFRLFHGGHTLLAKDEHRIVIPQL